MLAIPDLRLIAAARLAEATTLHAAGHYDGAAYLCGYSVELALKTRICRTRRWDGYPETKKEFERLESFRMHDLATLLRLTGRRNFVRARHVKEWSAFTNWTSELRYCRIGTFNAAEVQRMLTAAEVLLMVL